MVGAEIMPSQTQSDILQAKRSIDLRQKKGFDLDSGNPDHVTTYLQLRKFNARVTAESLVSALRNRETTLDMSAGHRFEYYGVPKRNFPDGLPPAIMALEVKPEEIAELEQVGGGKMDSEDYYVVDCQAPRQSLWRNVKIYELTAKKKVRYGTQSGLSPSAGVNIAITEKEY